MSLGLLRQEANRGKKWVGGGDWAGGRPAKKKGGKTAPEADAVDDSLHGVQRGLQYFHSHASSVISSVATYSVASTFRFGSAVVGGLALSEVRPTMARLWRGSALRYAFVMLR